AARRAGVRRGQCAIRAGRSIHGRRRRLRPLALSHQVDARRGARRRPGHRARAPGRPRLCADRPGVGQGCQCQAPAPVGTTPRLPRDRRRLARSGWAATGDPAHPPGRARRHYHGRRYRGDALRRAWARGDPRGDGARRGGDRALLAGRRRLAAAGGHHQRGVRARGAAGHLLRLRPGPPADDRHARPVPGALPRRPFRGPAVPAQPRRRAGPRGGRIRRERVGRADAGDRGGGAATGDRPRAALRGHDPAAGRLAPGHRHPADGGGAQPPADPGPWRGAPPERRGLRDRRAGRHDPPWRHGSLRGERL
ncbi:MAG: hypothetical protein AVDCRST_MAG88-2661, partial [uncultured Thermomicrobiales bacterium]